MAYLAELPVTESGKVDRRRAARVAAPATFPFGDAGLSR